MSCASPVPVAWETLLRWSLEVAETLHMLHSTAGVRLCHGDVTARNVALCPGEGGRLEAYVLDLGVSRHNHPHGMQDPGKRWSASVPPEAEAGLDPSADVWSWGVLLYSLLTWSLARVSEPTDGALTQTMAAGIILSRCRTMQVGDR